MLFAWRRRTKYKKVAVIVFNIVTKVRIWFVYLPNVNKNYKLNAKVLMNLNLV